jgi:hypothetical protein
MPAGWTVSAVLAHMAFWDQRSALLLERWQRDGVTPPPDDEANIDWIADATKPLFLAVVPRRAAEIAIASAEAADRAAERLSQELVDRNAAIGTPVNLTRADHRRGHLDDIERALRVRTLGRRGTLAPNSFREIFQAGPGILHSEPL